MLKKSCEESWELLLLKKFVHLNYFCDVWRKQGGTNLGKSGKICSESTQENLGEKREKFEEKPKKNWK